MQILIEKAAAKYLQSLPVNQRHLILNGIAGLRTQPPQGDIKPLKGYHDGRQRLRVGKYRVIFKYDTSGKVTILVIMDVGSRGDIYK